MAQKPITMIAGAFGHAEGKTPLNAFDNALLAAGIGNVNLLKISSIVPPNTRIIALPRIKPGSIIPMAYASMVSEVPGEIIAAAVAWRCRRIARRPGSSWKCTTRRLAWRQRRPWSRCSTRRFAFAARRSTN